MITFKHSGREVQGWPTKKFMSSSSLMIDLEGREVATTFVGSNYTTWIPISPLAWRRENHGPDWPQKSGARLLAPLVQHERRLEILDDYGGSYILIFEFEEEAYERTIALLRKEELLKEEGA